VTVRRLNRHEVIEIRWVSGIEFCERNDFIFNSFRNSEPAKRFQNRSDVLEFWSLDNSSKGCMGGRRRSMRREERGRGGSPARLLFLVFRRL